LTFENKLAALLVGTQGQPNRVPEGESAKRFYFFIDPIQAESKTDFDVRFWDEQVPFAELELPPRRFTGEEQEQCGRCPPS